MKNFVSNPGLIDVIIYSLKNLCYEFENWNPDWVENVLTTKCPPRDDLLKWSILQLGLLPEVSICASTEFIYQKLHREFISVGICNPSDINIIEASASSIVQLMFWKNLLQTITNINNYSSQLDKYFKPSMDQLLDNLLPCHYFQELNIKNDDFSLLPADLKMQFETMKKVENETSITQLTLSDMCDKLTNISSTMEFHSDDLCLHISSLIRQLQLFPVIYDSCFGPWCKQYVNQIIAKSNITVDHVNQNFQNLSILIETLKLEDDLEGSVSSLNMKVNHIINLKHSTPMVLSRISGTFKKVEV